MSNTAITILAGQIKSDVKLEYTKGGTAVVEFWMPADHGWGDRKVSVGYTVRYYGKGAEGVAPYLAKNKSVCVTGSVENPEVWLDKRTGEPKFKMVLTADNLRFLPDGGSVENGNSNGTGETYATAGVAAHEEDELPF